MEQKNHIGWIASVMLLTPTVLAEPAPAARPTEALAQEQQQLQLLKRQLVLMNQQVQQQQALQKMAQQVQAREQAINPQTNNDASAQ
ncbi:hypothetical protein FJQ87_17485 [Shewanella sp. SNU WT4]|uniref:hypothetical protein n=1 Tax=Shewanella sp. SNU WT4 TaxID=2590015 RepID=UPI00112A9989|nr:hypothetical protein [Shewanella sp. SNU WT4]QDF68228.1 hypothetical protein FJQ87_17485 [Shewanella sp. SNU WT4]